MQSDIWLGSRGDSYYEQWLINQDSQTDRTEPVHLKIYEDAMQGIHAHIVKRRRRASPRLYKGLVNENRAKGLGYCWRDVWRCIGLLHELTFGSWYCRGLSLEILQFQQLAEQPERDWYIKGSRPGGPATSDTRYMLRPETIESSSPAASRATRATAPTPGDAVPWADKQETLYWKKKTEGRWGETERDTEIFVFDVRRRGVLPLEGFPFFILWISLIQSAESSASKWERRA
ncbi:hypothetical protein DFH09DRAFT_1102920 [Mycena vulgaris]|nr:hypothetical protein DFH09DRAFT_1102920 [Mycena vulgaris]